MMGFVLQDHFSNLLKYRKQETIPLLFPPCPILNKQFLH